MLSFDERVSKLYDDFKKVQNPKYDSYRHEGDVVVIVIRRYKLPGDEEFNHGLK